MLRLLRTPVTAKTAGIHVRPAVPEDYEAVLAILPDLYGGTDYMPHTYHSYFTDPQAHPYLYEVDGVVASFGMHYVVDGGRTAEYTSARTMKRYEGRGLNHQVRTASLMAALLHHPHLHTESYVVIDSDYYQQFRKPNSRNLTIVHEVYLLQYITTRSAVVQLLDHLERTYTEDASIMDKDTAATTLPDILLTSDIFKDATFMTPNSYIALKVNKENLTLVCSGTDVVATFSAGHEKVCKAVSFSVFQQVKTGPAVLVFFYGKTVQDFFTHLKAHLVHRREEFAADGDADLQIGFPLDVSVEEVKKEVLPFLGENLISDELPRETAFVLERPVHASSQLQQEKAESETS